mmetsp:Transcript_96220/g.271976  ORF Transcript_96220/g.271976 Transcript_96220/m.271976 type:complete len:254 (-) Transcript_96220:917-1678(-)
MRRRHFACLAHCARRRVEVARLVGHACGHAAVAKLRRRSPYAHSRHAGRHGECSEAQQAPALRWRVAPLVLACRVGLGKRRGFGSPHPRETRDASAAREPPAPGCRPERRGDPSPQLYFLCMDGLPCRVHEDLRQNISRARGAQPRFVAAVAGRMGRRRAKRPARGKPPPPPSRAIRVKLQGASSAAPSFAPGCGPGVQQPPQKGADSVDFGGELGPVGPARVLGDDIGVDAGARYQSRLRRDSSVTRGAWDP